MEDFLFSETFPWYAFAESSLFKILKYIAAHRIFRLIHDAGRRSSAVGLIPNLCSAEFAEERKSAHKESAINLERIVSRCIELMVPVAKVNLAGETV